MTDREFTGLPHSAEESVTSAGEDTTNSSLRNGEAFRTEGMVVTEPKRGSNRGFAAMDREKQKQIASAGGRAAHRQGVAHEWSKDEARVAGRKGGHAVSQNRNHMAEIGRKGGQNSGLRRQESSNGTARGDEL